MAIVLANLLDLFGKVSSLRGPHKNHMLACGAWVAGVTFPKVLPLQLFWLGFWIYLEKYPPRNDLTQITSWLVVSGSGGWLFPKCYLGNCFGYTFEFIAKKPSLKGAPKNHMLACSVWIRGVTFPNVHPRQLFWLGFGICFESQPP